MRAREWLFWIAEREASMKLKLNITPDLARIMAAEIAVGDRAVTATVREAGSGLKTAWRGQITGAGLGQRRGSRA